MRLYPVPIAKRNGDFVNLNLDSVPMKPVQLRMARAAVKWGVRELAKKAGVAANTITRIENGADSKQSTMDALQGALEAAGVEFIDGDRPGVRLAKGGLEPISRSDRASNARSTRA
jgi:transcriptional regulator with XRE-family HTH domain